MSLQIQWTPVALQSLSEVLEYTYDEFGERQLHKLTSRIHAVTRRLASFPLSGKREEKLSEVTGIEYRSTVVIREIKLLYTINDDIISIEFVKNTRMSDFTMLTRLNDALAAMLFVKNLSVRGGQPVPADERGIDALINKKYKK